MLVNGLLTVYLKLVIDRVIALMPESRVNLLSIEDQSSDERVKECDYTVINCVVERLILIFGDSFINFRN